MLFHKTKLSYGRATTESGVEEIPLLNSRSWSWQCNHYVRCGAVPLPNTRRHVDTTITPCVVEMPVQTL